MIHLIFFTALLVLTTVSHEARAGESGWMAVSASDRVIKAENRDMPKYEKIGPSFRLSDFKTEDSNTTKHNKKILSECRKQAAREAKTDMGVRVLIGECDKEYKKREVEYE